jgi:hypothetical protein
MKASYTIVSIILSFGAGYFLHHYLTDKSTITPIPLCCETEVNANFCNLYSQESSLESISLDDATSAYRRYLSTGFMDTLGFSINNELLKDLFKQGAAVDNIAGFRCYPGLNTSGEKIILIAPLNSGGYEDDTNLYRLSVPADDELGLVGPCPPWCIADQISILREE